MLVPGVGQAESKYAFSVPKNAGRRGLYKTISPLYGLPLYRPFTENRPQFGRAAFCFVPERN